MARQKKTTEEKAVRKTAPKAPAAKPAKKAAEKKASTKKVSAKKAPAKKAPAKKTSVKSAPAAVKKAAKPIPKAVESGVLKAEIETNQVVWIIDPKVYPLDVVYQAAFVYIDRAYLFLDRSPDGELVVTLKGKGKLKKTELEMLLGEFANELLNQAVRKTLAKENHRLRELIVAKALFSAGRPEELREIVSAVTPPSGGAGGEKQPPRPWDEATQEEQDELDRLLAEIEEDFADDPMGIAVPWDEKYGEGEGGEKGGKEPKDS